VGPETDTQKKVLSIMVDGWRPDVIAAAHTPNLDRLWADSAYSLEARVEDTTISGSGQSTFVTGVHRDKHGVDNNSFEGHNYENYPYWFSLLDDAAPELMTGAYHTWAPMFLLPLEGGALADIAVFHDYTSDEGDAKTTTQLAHDLLTTSLDVVVWMLSDLDTAGHQYGFDPEVLEYVAAMALIDEQIGQVLEAVANRTAESEATEDWMVIISTDHAGSGFGHGDNIPEHRRVPLFVWGGSAVPGPIWPPPDTVSVVSTALAHLEIVPDLAWGLDGEAVGLGPSAPPDPVLGANLIVNAGAEMERGYSYFFPDAALPGWEDEGYATAIRYGGEGFPSEGGPGPTARGDNFFCGGGTGSDTEIVQNIDISGLSELIDEGGLRYDLAGWLGGYADQEDRAEFKLELFDNSGVVVESGVLEAISATERGDETGLFYSAVRGGVPPFVRSARVTVLFSQSAGYNDGYADNLSLILSVD
jgi:hypothetical protein